MDIIFLLALFVVVVVLIRADKHKNKNKNNPKCDKKTCAGCEYYNNNICDKNFK